jgi:hypothetical protein
MVDPDYIDYVSSLKRGDVVDVEDVTFSYAEWSLFYDHLKWEELDILDDTPREGYFTIN